MLEDMTYHQLIEELKNATRWYVNARHEVLHAQARCEDVQRMIDKRFPNG